ncbi:dihydrolipoyl dehydrogenase [Chloroflexota bacterium]
MKQSDLVIIGSGPAGYVSAIRAAQLGAGVVVVEDDALGGTCLNRGCIPTKTLLHSVQVLEEIRHSGDYGITTGEPAVDFVKMMARKNAVINKLCAGIQYLLGNNKVTTLKGKGKLVSPGEVMVTGEQAGNVLAGKVIVATGSVPVIISVPGIEGAGVITSNEALQLTEIPRSLVIIGGGVIGVEMARIFSGLGSSVTIVEMLPHIVPTEDTEISLELQRVLERDGIKIFTNTRVIDILDNPCGGKFIGVIAGETEQRFTSDLVMVAVGRKANISGLGIEEIGIKTDRGNIIVNENMETSVPGVYAAGDVTGGLQLAHLASAEGVIAVENALGKTPEVEHNLVPRCIYTRPEIAAVGLTEEQAQKEGLNLKVGKFPFATNSKAIISGQTDGFVKIISDDDSREIVGAHILGPNATEMIHEIVLAMRMEVTASEICSTVHAHPTLSETIREAALNVGNAALHM